MKAISTRYHGPTDTRGAVITASDLDGNSATVNVLASCSIEENHIMAARMLVNKSRLLGERWRGTYVMGSLGQDYVFVCLDGAQTFEV